MKIKEIVINETHIDFLILLPVVCSVGIVEINWLMFSSSNLGEKHSRKQNRKKHTTVPAIYPRLIYIKLLCLAFSDQANVVFTPLVYLIENKS